jgi:hypothetical protein
VYDAAALSIPLQQSSLTVENQMSKSLILVLTLMAAMLMIGCAKSESTTNKDATTPATTKPASSPAATTATSTASAESIGVPECDAFIKSYEACVRDKVPEQARAQFNTGLAQWRKSWHDLAQNPQTKATLVGVCKTQLESAKTSMKAYGCSF